MSQQIRYARHGAIGVVTIDNPPVNALGVAVVTGLKQAVERCLADPDVAALVLTGAGRTFIGGADIREFGQPRPADAPTLPEVIAGIEGCAKPVVAAINGTAAGGGLEVALGCHYRVAAPAARLGLPEVTLGIIPGAGGTQRLPRLIGLAAALDLILTGSLIPASRAQALGIVDELADDVVAAALSLAGTMAAENRPARKTRDMEDKLRADRGKPAIFDAARAKFAKQMRGVEAPAAAMESVANAIDLPFDQGLAKEREIFRRCLASEQSRALRYAFFAERQAAKVPDVPPETPTQPIELAAVVGCGTMGGGIAMNFANAGIPVRILESSREALDRGMGIVRGNYASTVAKGRLSQDDMDRRMALVTGTLDDADLAQADIVIEAVFEDMAIKRQVFARLDTTCKPATILATNTSTLDVDAIAAATARPDKVIGTHFFSPANVMRLMENVRGANTSKETIATVMRLAKTLGKVGVLVGVCDGFVGNRMLHAYTRQAGFLLEEGALPQQVDKVVYDFGFPMGPFAMGDLAGLDVGWRIRKAREATRPKHLRYSTIADRLCEMGRFGQKTGAGWYRYEPGSRTPIPDPAVEQLIASVAAELGMARRRFTDPEILRRGLYTMINEGAQILDEGVARRASDIDVIWLYGYGFPRHRGGPMFYADGLGLATVYDGLSRLYDEHGEWLKPAPLLARLAKQGKGFHDYSSAST
jgi:3-hydroxyacyl-CoA dehydrogenase